MTQATRQSPPAWDKPGPLPRHRVVGILFYLVHYVAGLAIAVIAVRELLDPYTHDQTIPLGLIVLPIVASVGCALIVMAYGVHWRRRWGRIFALTFCYVAIGHAFNPIWGDRPGLTFLSVIVYATSAVYLHVWKGMD